jgi:hypothetical protein
VEEPVSLHHLDGPRFCAWVRSCHHDLNTRRELGDSSHSRWLEWEAGAAVHYASADRVLLKLGNHLSLVPDDLWVPDPRKGRTHRKAITDEERAGMREMRAQHRSYAEIADRFNVCAKTVERVVLA